MEFARIVRFDGPAQPVGAVVRREHVVPFRIVLEPPVDVDGVDPLDVDLAVVALERDADDRFEYVAMKILGEVVYRKPISVVSEEQWVGSERAEDLDDGHFA